MTLPPFFFVFFCFFCFCSTFSCLLIVNIFVFILAKNKPFFSIRHFYGFFSDLSLSPYRNKWPFKLAAPAPRIHGRGTVKPRNNRWPFNSVSPNRRSNRGTLKPRTENQPLNLVPPGPCFYRETLKFHSNNWPFHVLPPALASLVERLLPFKLVPLSPRISGVFLRPKAMGGYFIWYPPAPASMVDLFSMTEILKPATNYCHLIRHPLPLASMVDRLSPIAVTGRVSWYTPVLFSVTDPLGPGKNNRHLIRRPPDLASLEETVKPRSSRWPANSFPAGLV